MERGAQSQGEQAAASEEAIAELAEALPRALIAAGRAEGLAAAWVRARAQAVRDHGRAIPRWPFSRRIADALFTARRASQLVRGLEGAADALAREEAGLAKAASTRPGSGRRRISRLLVLSSDGSPRFYREAERLRGRFASRLECIELDCDEQALGGAVFGAGRRARALMLDHKQAVARLLELLDDPGEGASQDAGPPAHAEASVEPSPEPRPGSRG